MFSIRRRPIIFLSVLFLLLCIVLLYYSVSLRTFSEDELSELEKCDESCHTYLRRLDSYCHQKLLNLSLLQQEASEGILDKSYDQDALELVHAHVLIRHGDRTPVFDYRIGYPLFYECGLTDTHLDWNGLKDFPSVVPLPPSVKLNNKQLKLHPGVTSRRCVMGMLTQVGFKQHRSLGSLMQARYRKLLGNFSSGHFFPRDIFAHSTDMSRTIQSAAAFLLGFLPNSTHIRRATKIHVSPGTINHRPPPGVERVYPSCHNYYDYLDFDLEKNEYFRIEKTMFHQLLMKLCQILSIPAPDEPIVSHYFDHFMTRGCHNRGDPLPCFGHQCVDFPFALKLFDFNDWTWSHKFPTNSSTIRLLPFLRHSVLEPMLKVASQSTAFQKGDNPYSFKFMLTLSHDDTITMLLNALGYRPDRWIPYASRVVFELWRRENSGEHFVRVLFNGEEITKELTPGRGQSEQLIELNDWRVFLTTGDYKGPEAYSKVCGNH